MNAPENSQAGLSLVPLGAGDLIDRAVRFYRKNFVTFFLIASPPVVIGTLISVSWTLAGRQIFNLTGDKNSPEAAFYFIFVGFGSILIWLAETIATLIVMGGASRNFVRHLLYGEAISFRDTYRYAQQRLAGLFAASTMIAASLGFFGLITFYFGAILVVLAVAIAVTVFSFIPIVAFIVSVAAGLAVSFGTLWVFFLVASRLAYVPQVMLVEGQGVFSAIGRSATLASGNVRRLAALFLFTTVAAYSALALLYVPLAWYASANGVQVMGFDADMIPAWYEIAYNLIWQISFILLSPVWMVGLCLLYIDERVRSEGYDIELMAAARLGEIPAAAGKDVVGPAADIAADPAGSPSFTTLGLR